MMFGVGVAGSAEEETEMHLVIKNMKMKVQTMNRNFILFFH
jgi:hypothetical protein